MQPEQDSPALSVVLPVFNEEGNLRPLVEELLPILRGLERTFEIVIVDDGSTDGSPAIIEELAGTHPFVTVWRLDRNHGLSSALHAGFASARGAVIATMDTDLQNDPADLPALLERLEDTDMVCGWRRDRHDPWLKRVSSRIANAWRNRRTGDDFHDITCPLKVFRTEVRDAFPAFDGMHRFYPTLARMAGFRVLEVPVGHRPRHTGTSKYGIGNRLRRGMEDLRTVRWMQQRRLTYRKERIR